MCNVNGWIWVAVMIMVIPTATATDQGVITNKTYNVSPGQVVDVPLGNSVLLVDRFIMGNGSRMVISGDTSLFAIRAKAVTIGNDTKIVGRGHEGKKSSVPGGDGGPGATGPTIVLIAEQADIQGLKIVALGGAGGSGGKGVTGSRGRNASCYGHGAQRGGRGGSGGNGGNGGDGGNIFVVLPTKAGSYGIELNVNSGTPGSYGHGGDGGWGGRGLDCTLWWRGGEPDGPDGPDGDPGTLGRKGVIKWYRIADFEPATITNQIHDMISVLAKGGNAGNAAALEGALESGVLTGR